MSTTRSVDEVRRRLSEPVSVLLVGLTVLLFVTLPFHWHLLWGPASVNMSYGDAIVAAVGLCWFVGLFGPRRLPKYSLAVAAFVAAAVLSLSLAALHQRQFFSASSGVVELAKFAGSAAWMVAAFALARGRASRVVPIGAAASVAVAAAFAGWTVYSAVVWELVRLDGPFNNPNLYGQYLVCNACLALYLQAAWRDSVWPPIRWLCVLTVPVFATAVVATGSRGSLLAVVGATATIVVLSYRRLDTARLLAGLLAFGATVLGVRALLSRHDVFFYTHLRGRLLKDVDSRLEMWSAALEAARSSPVLGIGYGQVPPLLSVHTGEAVVAHNVYVTIGTETGLLGLAIFVGLLAWVLVDGWRLSVSAPAVVFLVAIVGGTALQGIGTDVDNVRSLWLTIGLIAAYDADVNGSEYSPRRLLTSIVQTLPTEGER